MDTQTFLNPLIVCETAVLAPTQLIQACSRDYGFDCDEDEIACEMLAPLPASLSRQGNSQGDADESGFDNLWFLS